MIGLKTFSLDPQTISVYYEFQELAHKDHTTVSKLICDFIKENVEANKNNQDKVTIKNQIKRLGAFLGKDSPKVVLGEKITPEVWAHLNTQEQISLRIALKQMQFEITQVDRPRAKK